jgi:hypothetical protein
MISLVQIFMRYCHPIFYNNGLKGWSSHLDGWISCFRAWRDSCKWDDGWYRPPVFFFFGFNLYITVLIHFYSVSQQLPHPQALVLVSRNQVHTMADMILAASEININRCRMCSEVLRLFNCCAFDQSSGCFRPGNNPTLERFRMTSDTISACNKIEWNDLEGPPQ